MSGGAPCLEPASVSSGMLEAVVSLSRDLAGFWSASAIQPDDSFSVCRSDGHVLLYDESCTSFKDSVSLELYPVQFHMKKKKMID